MSKKVYVFGLEKEIDLEDVRVHEVRKLHRTYIYDKKNNGRKFTRDLDVNLLSFGTSMANKGYNVELAYLTEYEYKKSANETIVFTEVYNKYSNNSFEEGNVDYYLGSIKDILKEGKDF